MSRNVVPGRKSLMTLGVMLVLFGVLLLVSPAAVGAAVVRLVAVVLVVTGLVQVVQGLRSGRVTHALVALVLGLVVAGVGVFVWLNPENEANFLTALLMVFFIVNGMWKLSTAIRYRNVTGWGWVFLSGLVPLIFVYLLWAQWPLTGFWAIGILVGLDLFLSGISLIVVAVRMRRIRSVGEFDTISL